MIYDFSFLQHVSYEPLDAPLTQDEIAAFEQLNGIVVPDEYKQFLLTVGNGIRIHVGEKGARYIYGISRPINKQFNRRLKMGFIFEEPYHDRLDTHDFEWPSDCVDPDKELEDSCRKCPHLDDCFYVNSDDLDEFDHMIYNGAYPICYAGCTYMYFLIVTGSRCGEVWINNEIYDFSPVKKSFGEFLRWVATTDMY